MLEKFLVQVYLHATMGQFSIPDRAKWLFQSRVRYIPGLKVVYLLNPKVASSSVLASMWKAHDVMTGRTTFEGNPHDLQASPFVVSGASELWGTALIELQRLPFFSIVRNPYARFASAYMDKVARQSDVVVWTNIRTTLRLPEGTPSVSTFLEAVMTADPATLDWHFCPQHVNLLASFVSLDFTGHMESLTEVEKFLAARGVRLEEYLPNPHHATGGAKLVSELIGPYEAKMIRRFYEADFALYGYSEDPTRITC